MTSTIKLFAALSIFTALFCGNAEAASTVVIRSTDTQCNGVSCRKSTGYGSGVVIGKFADGSDAVLTCAHNLSRGVTEVAWTGGEWVPAKLVIYQLRGSAPSDKFDAALLSAYLPGAECGVLSERGVNSIGVLTGFVPDRKPGWRNARGRYLHGQRTLVGVVSIQGESGGPVVDEQTGEILGIQWGTDGATESYMTTSVEIKAWIIERLGYLPACQRTVPRQPVQVAQPNCAVPTPQRNNDPIIIDVPACDCKNYDAEIAAIRAEIKAMKAPVKVQIQRDGKVIDEDTYDVFNGQPIVLNFKKKTSQPQSATGK